MRRMASKGFSLVELLVAVSLFGALIAVLASVQTTALTLQGAVLGKTVVGNNASVIAKALAHDLAEASFVESPAPGAASASLTTWTNIDPTDGISPILSSLQRGFAHFCLDSRGRLLRYGGVFPRPTIPCGSAISGREPDVVAGGPGNRLRVRPLFFRPPPDGRFLQVQYDVTLRAVEPGKPSLQAVHITEFSLRR